MSNRIKTPVNQRLLTNVALVRLKKGTARFELACYPNKVEPYREGIEKDIDEVLQSPHIFSNAIQGQFASKKALKKHFGTDDIEECYREILQKGELQVTQAERQVQQDNMYKDIATMVAEKCVNSENGRAYTAEMIERCMRDVLHYSLKKKSNTKQQALLVIKLLAKHIPICRAPMRVRVVLSSSVYTDPVATQLRELTKEIEETREEHECVAVRCLIEPRALKEIEEALREWTAPAGESVVGRLEVLDVAVFAEGGDVSLSVAELSSGGQQQPAKQQKAVTNKGAGGKQCRSCKVSFDDAEEHRAHYKTAWHRANLKLKLDGKEPMTEEEFKETEFEQDNELDLYS